MSNITVIFHLSRSFLCQLCCSEPLEFDIESLKRIYNTSIMRTSHSVRALMLIKTVKSRNVLDLMLSGPHLTTRVRS